jgi:hypothetical protein
MNLLGRVLNLGRGLWKVRSRGAEAGRDEGADEVERDGRSHRRGQVAPREVSFEILSREDQLAWLERALREGRLTEAEYVARRMAIEAPAAPGEAPPAGEPPVERRPGEVRRRL